MSDLDEVIERVEALRTTYDLKTVESEVIDIAAALTSIRDRERRAEVALCVVGQVSDMLVGPAPEGMPTEQLIADGLVCPEEIPGEIEPFYSLTVKGDALIRRSLLELYKANREPVGVQQ